MFVLFEVIPIVIVVVGGKRKNNQGFLKEHLNPAVHRKIHFYRSQIPRMTPRSGATHAPNINKQINSKKRKKKKNLSYPSVRSSFYNKSDLFLSINHITNVGRGMCGKCLKNKNCVQHDNNYQTCGVNSPKMPKKLHRIDFLLYF